MPHFCRFRRPFHLSSDLRRPTELSDTEKTRADFAFAIAVIFSAGLSPETRNVVVNPRDKASDDPLRRSSLFSRDSDIVRRQGVAAVCMGNVSECAWLGRLLPSPGRIQEVTLARRFLGWSGNLLSFP